MGTGSSPRRVMLVASTTGYQVRSFGEAARRLGVDVVLATDRCHVLEDPWRDGAVAIRFEDPRGAVDAIRDVAARRPLHGMLAVGDRPACLAAAAAEALGLRGHPPAAAHAAANKLATRQCFRSSGLPVPWFRPFPIGTARDGIPVDLTFPCVVKPLSMAGSRGVMRADSPDQLRSAFARLRALLEAPDVTGRRDASNEIVLVEGFVAGPEVAVEGIVSDGVLHLLAMFDKPDPLDGPFFEETIYVTPSRLEKDAKMKIHRAVEAAVASLGLSNGPIHAECRIGGDEVVVLEVAARPIGGLCAKTLRFETPGGQSVSLESILLRHALGESVSDYRRERAARGVMMIPIPDRGRYRAVRGLDAALAVDHVDEVVITAKPGQHVMPPPEGDSYLGFIFVKATAPGDAVLALREAHRLLRFDIQPVLPVVSR